MTLLRTAVVGTGALGRHHARILSQMEGTALVAVADTNPVAGSAVAEKCGTRWVPDYRDVLGEVDAVVIAVPTSAHWRVATDCLEQGLDVLVEKPIAATIGEAEQLVALARKQSAILQVGHVERFNPVFKAATSYLSGPRYIRAERYSPYSFRSTDIGVVHDVMIHDIDLVLSLVDASVERVEALGVSILGGHEDCAQARIVFANGCIVDLSANRVSPVTRRTMQVWSPEGCTHLDFGAREVVVYGVSPGLRFGMSPLERARQPGADIEQLKRDVFGTYLQVERPVVVACDQLTEELLDFRDCVQTRRPPVVSGVQALDAVRVAGEILERVVCHQWDGTAAGAVGPNPDFRSAHKLAG